MNEKHKFYAAGHGVAQREVSKRWPMSESYFCRFLQDHELTDDEAEKFCRIVDEIYAERGRVGD